MRDELLTKNELDNLAADEQRARYEYNRAHEAAQIAEQTLRLAEKRHYRACLWAKAERLRRELAEVENEAGKITL